MLQDMLSELANVPGVIDGICNDCGLLRGKESDEYLSIAGRIGRVMEFIAPYGDMYNLTPVREALGSARAVLSFDRGSSLADAQGLLESIDSDEPVTDPVSRVIEKLCYVRGYIEGLLEGSKKDS